jgi:hypothetical protein
MMKRFDMRVLLAVCFAIAPDGVACAQHADTRGQGAIHCEAFGVLRERSTDLEDKFFDWAEGYASGINAARPRGYFDLNAKEPDEMKLYLRRYCDTHPKALYSAGVWDFVHSLPLIDE